MARKKVRVAVIGCGTIGAALAKACKGRLQDAVELVAVSDIQPEKAAALARDVGGGVTAVPPGEAIRRADLIVEAASAAVSGDIAAQAIAAKKSVLIMSVGGLIGREDLLGAAEAEGVRVFVPSGALSGIDGLKSAAVGRIDSVTLTTRKPVKGLAGAPYLAQHGVDLAAVTGETVVFEGSAAEAVKGFPQNVNVSAILSLAGIGAEKTRVRIVTSPAYTRNTHEVEVRGAFGTIRTVTENLPSEENPKTSMLAVLSAIATLESSARSVRIGT